MRRKGRTQQGIREIMRSDGFGHNGIVLSVGYMWYNRGHKGHLIWKGQCTGSEGQTGALVECLGDLHVGVQEASLSVVRLAPGCLFHPGADSQRLANAVIFLFAWILNRIIKP